MKKQSIKFLAVFFVVSFCFGPESVAVEKEVGGIVLKETPADMVKVTEQEGAWGSGEEKFPTVWFALNSGRFVYQIRHDQKYGNGAIGLSQPTQGNWYQAGMLHLYLDGKRFNLLPANNEKADIESGKKGEVALSWENETAKANYNFVLFAGDDKLFLEITLEPKVAIKDIEIRLQNYVSGFNRSNPEHILYTPIREIVKKGRNELDPQKENYILYADNTLDPANNDKALGPSAVLFEASDVESVRVHTGGYGVSTSLKYRPTAKRMLFCFWEFPKESNEEALKYFKESAPEAGKILDQPETFSRPYER